MRDGESSDRMIFLGMRLVLPLMAIGLAAGVWGFAGGPRPSFYAATIAFGIAWVLSTAAKRRGGGTNGGLLAFNRSAAWTARTFEAKLRDSERGRQILAEIDAAAVTHGYRLDGPRSVNKARQQVRQQYTLEPAASDSEKSW